MSDTTASAASPTVIPDLVALTGAHGIEMPECPRPLRTVGAYGFRSPDRGAILPLSAALELLDVWSRLPIWSSIREIRASLADALQEEGDAFEATNATNDFTREERRAFECQERGARAAKGRFGRQLDALLDQHHDVLRFVEEHYPEVAGDVPLIPSEEGFDRHGVTHFAQQMLRARGLVLSRIPRPKASQPADTLPALGAQEPAADATPTAGASDGKDEPHGDGPEGGRWLWWKGKRYDVPEGNLYRLISYMWSRDFARYDDLMNGAVFDDTVVPQTVRSNLCSAGQLLCKIGVPWRLSADSKARIVTKDDVGQNRVVKKKS